MTKDVFCCDKHVFVVTKISNQTMFLATNILLSQKKTCFVMSNVFVNTCLLRQTCLSFVTTKMVLVAAPANDEGFAGSVICLMDCMSLFVIILLSV